MAKLEQRLVDELRRVLVLKDFCSGCLHDSGSQRKHECLMEDDVPSLSTVLDTALEEFESEVATALKKTLDDSSRDDLIAYMILMKDRYVIPRDALYYSYTVKKY